jgi:hypothetical protein
MTRIEHSPEATLKGTQLIAVMLMAGIISSMVIVVFIINNGVIERLNSGRAVSLVMAGLTLLSFLLLAALSQLRVRQPARLAIHEIWQRRMVLRFALLEGTALLNGAAAICERNWWAFALMVGVFAVMAWLFPTQSRFDRFLEKHQATTA